jgi:hypothetical protein
MEVNDDGILLVLRRREAPEMGLAMVKAQAYLKTGKSKKSAMLDDFCESIGYCRRHATLRGEPHNSTWTSPCR